MLTPREIKEHSKLTPEEQAAINNLFAALKALPPSLCISLDDYDYEFSVQKRVTTGFAAGIGKKIKKKSLFF